MVVGKCFSHKEFKNFYQISGQGRTTQEKLNGIQIESPYVSTYMWVTVQIHGEK